MKNHVVIRISILSSVMSLLLMVFLIVPVFAEQDYGIFVVTDSGKPELHDISQKMRSIFKTIREANEMLGKDSLPLRFCDYGDPQYAPYCQQILRVPRDYVPFIGIAVIDGKKDFVKFVDGKNLIKVTDGRLGAEGIMKMYKDLLPADQQKNYRYAIFTGIGELTTVPSGVQVAVDSKNLPSPAPLKDIALEEGTHEVILTLKGHEEKRIRITLEYGDSKKINESLKALIGNLIITSTPSGADVVMGGKVKGKTPLNLTGIPVGEYVFEVKKANFKSSQGSAFVKQDQTVTQSVIMKRAKVSCNFEVKSNEVEISVMNNLTHRLETKTFRVDEREAAKKLKAVLEKSSVFMPAPKDERPEVTVSYEITPTQEFKGEIVVRDNQTGSILYQETHTTTRPALPNSWSMLDTSVKLFESNALKKIIDIVKKHFDL